MGYSANSDTVPVSSAIDERRKTKCTPDRIPQGCGRRKWSLIRTSFYQSATHMTVVRYRRCVIDGTWSSIGGKEEMLNTQRHLAVLMLKGGKAQSVAFPSCCLLLCLMRIWLAFLFSRILSHDHSACHPSFLVIGTSFGTKTQSETCAGDSYLKTKIEDDRQREKTPENGNSGRSLQSLVFLSFPHLPASRVRVVFSRHPHFPLSLNPLLSTSRDLLTQPKLEWEYCDVVHGIDWKICFSEWETREKRGTK